MDTYIKSVAEKIICIVNNPYGLTFLLTIFDFGTGAVQALGNRTFTSSVMRKGIFHKAALWGLMSLAAILEVAKAVFPVPGIAYIPFGYAACAMVALMEINSILENLHKANPQIPSNLGELVTALTTNDRKEDGDGAQNH